MKIKRLLIAIGYAVLSIFVFDAGWRCGVSKEKQVHENYIPTVEEIQARLNVPVDGVMGPVTQKAWDRYTCDRYAIETFAEAGQE